MTKRNGIDLVREVDVTGVPVLCGITITARVCITFYVSSERIVDRDHVRKRAKCK